jgi:hypothetical protein
MPRDWRATISLRMKHCRRRPRAPMRLSAFPTRMQGIPETIAFTVANLRARLGHIDALLLILTLRCSPGDQPGEPRRVPPNEAVDSASPFVYCCGPFEAPPVAVHLRVRGGAGRSRVNLTETRSNSIQARRKPRTRARYRWVGFVTSAISAAKVELKFAGFPLLRRSRCRDSHQGLFNLTKSISVSSRNRH